jgi:hypothetical protein
MRKAAAGAFHGFGPGHPVSLDAESGRQVFDCRENETLGGLIPAGGNWNNFTSPAKKPGSVPESDSNRSSDPDF